MCKCCQNCFESCYWHLIEKHFCFDEEIALYAEHTENDEKNNNLYDNLAFYDKVAIIAGRSIVTIDPLPSKSYPPTPIISQPPRRIRWWEDDVDEQNRVNEEKFVQHSHSNEELTSETKNEPDEKIKHGVSLIEREKSKSITDISLAGENKSTNELPIISRLQKYDDSTFPSTSSSSKSSLDEKPKMRKKSLKERRMSRSLTLDIERALELPIIKQQSMPKFYVDSPDASKLDIPGQCPSSVLVSPRIRKESKIYEYDLRSVVQIENEKKIKIQQHAPIHKQMSHSKLLSIKDKLIKPQDKLKHQMSTGSLPNPFLEKKTSEAEPHLTRLLQ